MTFALPHSYGVPSQSEITEIQQSTVVMDGFLYFHRLPNPTAATVVYTSKYLKQILKQHQLQHMVLDFTGRGMVDHSLRRLMLQHMSTPLLEMQELAIVLGGNNFRRVLIDFFVRSYLRHRDINVSFWQSKEEAIDYMEQLLKPSTLRQ